MPSSARVDEQIIRDQVSVDTGQEMARLSGDFAL